jgi:hypothetical protein
MVGMLVHLDASTHQWIAGPLMMAWSCHRADHTRAHLSPVTASTFIAMSVARRCGRFCEFHIDRVVILDHRGCQPDAEQSASQRGRWSVGIPPNPGPLAARLADRASPLWHHVGTPAQEIAA